LSKLLPLLLLQILSMRRKLNYLFKVLTGSVTGHYLLDLRNEQHRCTGECDFCLYNKLFDPAGNLPILRVSYCVISIDISQC